MNKKLSWLLILDFLIISMAGCAGVPVREAAKVDMKAPVGKIEGYQFTGIRYPFNVAAPPGWKVSTEYPKFMLDLGYEKDGLEESEVFVYNPETQSNLQSDFAAADRYSTFDQQKIEGLTNAVTGEMQDELKQDLGKDLKTEVGPTERPALKGVPYAAKKYVTYTAPRASSGNRGGSTPSPRHGPTPAPHIERVEPVSCPATHHLTLLSPSILPLRINPRTSWANGEYDEIW